MKQSRVAIIIINWKLKEATLACLRSLEHVTSSSRVIVVDNGSHDGSVEYLQQHAPYIDLIALPTNTGFGYACNQAISHALTDAACEYVWIINNDALVDPGALTALLNAAEQHPDAGILGTKIYYHDRRDTFWYAGARRRRYVLAAADTGRGQHDYGQFETVREVDYVFGAAMLIRREVLETIGTFDEQFFLYLEDLDLCIRAQQANIRLLFVPEARIWHSVSASTRRCLGMRRYHMVKSTLLFLKKHTSTSSFAIVLLFWLLVYLRFVLTDLLQGQFATLRAYALGLWSGLREAPEETSAPTPSMGTVYSDANVTRLSSE